MRQWNQIEGASFVTNSEGATDDFVQLLECEKLRDGEFSDGNDQLRLQEIDLIVHPVRAISDLVRRGNPIAASGRFGWKTPADGGEVNLRTHLGLGHVTKFLEPTEESAPGSPGERLPQDRLFHAGRLA